MYLYKHHRQTHYLAVTRQLKSKSENPQIMYRSLHRCTNTWNWEMNPYLRRNSHNRTKVDPQTDLNFLRDDKARHCKQFQGTAKLINIWQVCEHAKYVDFSPCFSFLIPWHEADMGL